MRKFILSVITVASVALASPIAADACPSALRRSVVRERVRVVEPIRRERVVVREKVVREPVIRERIVERQVQSHCADCVQEFRVERFRSSY